MAQSDKTKGKCSFCNRKMTAGGMVRHLRSCDEREDTIQNVQEGREQMLFHLYIKNAYLSEYWLHLEMNGTATLDNLDNYLRQIWLECCGHMSQITYGNDPWGTEISMNKPISQLLEPNMQLTHTYDFGTSTETSITVSDERRGRPLSKHPIYLMARNEMPKITCEECGKQADWLYEDYEAPSFDGPTALCEKHLQSYEDEPEYYVSAIVNSPRMGVCGYEGPAEPPY